MSREQKRGRRAPAPLQLLCALPYCGQFVRPGPLPGGPVCVPLGLTPSGLGPQPGLYCEFELLPLLLGLLAASTPPVPAAIRATAISAAMPRDFTASPFGREVAAFAIALVLILSRSKASASALPPRSRSATSSRSPGRFWS